jgi:predicted DNA-binding transcriptional regulator AlpA
MPARVRLISQAEVLERIPVSAATMWRQIKLNRFPQPISIAERRVAF